MFNIDFNILINLFLPYALRQLVLTAWIKCLIAPIKSIYNDFKTYRDLCNVKLQFTGQVIYLEKMLNDYYSETIIYIEDAANIDYEFVYNKSEGLPAEFVYNKSESMPSVFVKNKSELEVSYHFIVKIPSALYASLGASGLNKMRAIINMYKIGGKNFLIEVI
ncbi:MAG: hypothetical protein NTZ33_11305 [Bacteroidetes bacterium]|nr:hypothetical protein [Bacteroidota bacterium]